MQPLTTTDPNKGHLTPEAKPFFSSNDKRLDHAVEISNWIQNSWHLSVHSNGLNKEVENERGKACFMILFEFKINM